MNETGNLWTILLGAVILFVMFYVLGVKQPKANNQGEPEQKNPEPTTEQKNPESTTEKPNENPEQTTEKENEQRGHVLQKIKMFETRRDSDAAQAQVLRSAPQEKSESFEKRKEIFKNSPKTKKSSQSDLIPQELESLIAQPTDIAGIRNQFKGDSLIETVEMAQARNQALRDRSVQAARIYETYSSAISQRFGSSTNQSSVAQRVQVLIDKALTPLQLSAQLDNNPVMFNVLRRITSVDKDSLQSTHGVMILVRSTSINL